MDLAVQFNQSPIHPDMRGQLILAQVIRDTSNALIDRLAGIEDRLLDGLVSGKR